MPPTPRAPLGDAAFDQLLALARLDLDAERKTAAAPAVDLVMSLMDSLDEVEVGETPPATAFDPRWT